MSLLLTEFGNRVAEDSKILLYEPINCELIEPSTMNIFVACFLMGGIMLSYIPQYVSLIRTKTSEGLSISTMGLGLLSGFLTAINSGILRWPHMVCCGQLMASQCFTSNLPTWQLVVSVTSAFILYVLYLYYIRRPVVTSENTTEMYKAATVFVASLVLSVCVIATGLILYYRLDIPSNVLVMYAQVMGIISSVLMGIQWAPQIITTWRLKSQGSLSMLMLLLQIPGSILVIVFQGVINQADVSTWLPYLFVFLEESILVVMILYFRRRGNRTSVNNGEHDASNPYYPFLPDEQESENPTWRDDYD